jgi:hypothetical protein
MGLAVARGCRGPAIHTPPRPPSRLTIDRGRQRVVNNDEAGVLGLDPLHGRLPLRRADEFHRNPRHRHVGHRHRLGRARERVGDEGEASADDGFRGGVAHLSETWGSGSVRAVSPPPALSTDTPAPIHPHLARARVDHDWRAGKGDDGGAARRARAARGRRAGGDRPAGAAGTTLHQGARPGRTGVKRDAAAREWGAPTRTSLLAHCPRDPGPAMPASDDESGQAAPAGGGEGEGGSRCARRGEGGGRRAARLPRASCGRGRTRASARAPGAARRDRAPTLARPHSPQRPPRRAVRRHGQQDRDPCLRHVSGEGRVRREPARRAPRAAAPDSRPPPPAPSPSLPHSPTLTGIGASDAAQALPDGMTRESLR